MHRLAVIAALAGACSSAPAYDTAPPLPPETASADAPPAEEVCATGTAFECIAARRAACTEDTRVWRIEERANGVELPVAYVSETGLYVREVGGRTSFTVDGQRWLGCMPGCLADGSPGCVPLDDGEVRHPEGFACKLLNGEATWEGRTVSLYECSGEGLIMRLYVDPALEPVERALSRLRSSEKAIADLDGLDVAWLHGDDEARRVNVTPADCSAFALPTDAQSFTAPEHVAKMERLLPDYRVQHEATKKQRYRAAAEKAVQEGIRQLVAEASRVCFDDGAEHTIADIRTCAHEHPELAPRIQEISNRISDEQLRAQASIVFEVSDMLTVDYCRQFLD